jgi:hypothetical protein
MGSCFSPKISYDLPGGSVVLRSQKCGTPLTLPLYWNEPDPSREVERLVLSEESFLLPKELEVTPGAAEVEASLEEEVGIATTPLRTVIDPNE